MYIIAEIGINHGGDIDTAMRLCDAAKAAGADCVKTQLYTMDTLVIPDTLRDRYKELVPDLYKCRLERSDIATLNEYCKMIGIDFTATPEDFDGAAYLMSIGVPFIKIGSRQATVTSYVDMVVDEGWHVVISQGLCVPRFYWPATYLACVSEYPANVEDYPPLDKYHGVSDHTGGLELARITTGAKVWEAHLTLDRDADGPDHAVSLTPDLFKELVCTLR